MKKTGRPGTVAHLLREHNKVYIYCKSKNICLRFFKDAEEEGFTFGDGIKPTEKETSDIFALCDDWTISYTGFAANMWFHNRDVRGKESSTRIDYGKYLTGAKAKDYLITKALPRKPLPVMDGEALREYYLAKAREREISTPEVEMHSEVEMHLY